MELLHLLGLGVLALVWIQGAVLTYRASEPLFFGLLFLTAGVPFLVIGGVYWLTGRRLDLAEFVVSPRNGT